MAGRHPKYLLKKPQFPGQTEKADAHLSKRKRLNTTNFIMRCSKDFLRRLDTLCQHFNFDSRATVVKLAVALLMKEAPHILERRYAQVKDKYLKKSFLPPLQVPSQQQLEEEILEILLPENSDQVLNVLFDETAAPEDKDVAEYLYLKNSHERMSRHLEAEIQTIFDEKLQRFRKAMRRIIQKQNEKSNQKKFRQNI